MKLVYNDAYWPSWCQGVQGDASSAHAAKKMEELDNKIAEADQRLAIQTSSLADVSIEASTAQKEEMVLKAEAIF